MKWMIALLLLFSASFAQSSKMAKIKNKIKDKVEAKRAREKINANASSGSSNSATITTGTFTEEEFKRKYEFQPFDEIPWNATILVYDGRFEVKPFSPQRDISVINERLGQHYSDYPFKNKTYFDDYTGKKYFSRFNYNYGYDSSDKVVLNDYQLFFVYDNVSLRFNYKILTNDFGDENIDFTFTTISPGFFLTIEDWQTGINLYGGLASFAVQSKYSQTFPGLNFGIESLTMFGPNLSLQFKIENISVKDKLDDDNYIMNFFQTEIDIGYHWNRMKFSIGYQLQKFNDLGLKGDNRFLRQPNFGIHLFY